MVLGVVLQEWNPRQRACLLHPYRLSIIRLALVSQPFLLERHAAPNGSGPAHTALLEGVYEAR